MRKLFFAVGLVVMCGVASPALADTILSDPTGTLALVDPRCPGNCAPSQRHALLDQELQTFLLLHADEQVSTIETAVYAKTIGDPANPASYVDLLMVFNTGAPTTFPNAPDVAGYEDYALAEVDTYTLPEPSTLALVGTALVGLATRRRRGKKL